MRWWMMCLVLFAACLPVLADDAPPEPEAEEAAEEGAEEAAEKAAEEESLEALLRRIENAHKDNRDFQGKFEQRRYLPLFEDTITSSGSFAFRRPDRVRWEYTEPHRSILVVRGDAGHRWSAATDRVERFRLAEDRGLDAVVNQLFTWFRGEFTKLTEDYDVSIQQREPLTLELTPKAEAVRRYIARIRVTLDADLGITAIRLIEPAEEGEEPGYTHYEFKDTRLNGGLEDSVFRIER
jgi:outer membrane lipoprotein-sorting protein